MVFGDNKGLNCKPRSRGLSPSFHDLQEGEIPPMISTSAAESKRGVGGSEGLDLFVLHGTTYSFRDAVIGQRLLLEPLFFLLTGRCS